jgi:hypothetical protein
LAFRIWGGRKNRVVATWRRQLNSILRMHQKFEWDNWELWKICWITMEERIMGCSIFRYWGFITSLKQDKWE